MRASPHYTAHKQIGQTTFSCGLSRYSASMLPQSAVQDLRSRTIFPGWDDCVYWDAEYFVVPSAALLQVSPSLRDICRTLSRIKRATPDPRSTGWTRLHLSSNVLSKVSSLPIPNVPTQWTSNGNEHPKLLDIASICTRAEWLEQSFPERTDCDGQTIFRRADATLSTCVFYA